MYDPDASRATGEQQGAGLKEIVVKSDNRRWSPYGAPWMQPAASGGKCPGRERGGNKPKPLRRAATGCGKKPMVRRGSTVRVHQRALQNPAKSGILLSDLVQPSTSFVRRGSRVNGRSTPQRVAGKSQCFLPPLPRWEDGDRFWGPMAAVSGRTARARRPRAQTR
jgi:hypothetical protein